MKQLLRPMAGLMVVVAMLIAVQVVPKAWGVQFEGRDLIYRKHTDAVHIAWTGSGLDIKVKEGYDTIREAADVAIRLGPDADAEGNEVSRLKVPDDEAYAFMGKPGAIVWHAPQHLYAGWPPVWAGIGHGELPEGMTDLRLELVDDGGPGKVEIYTTTGLAGKPVRKLSSEETKFRSYTPGSHGHYSWIFTEPGVYRMQWRATATLADGAKVASPVATIPWLVGTDETVGLPAGTTQAAPILHPTDGAFADTAPTSKATPSVQSPSKPGRNELRPEHEFADNLTKHLSFCKPVEVGHLDISTTFDDAGAAWVRVMQDTAKGKQALPFNGGVIEVSDLAKQQVPEGSIADQLRKVLGSETVWELPETQHEQLPWPGFSSEELDFTNVERFAYTLTGTAAPDGGAWAIGGYDPAKQRFVVLADSKSKEPGRVELGERGHMHTGFYFSKPGFYTIKFTATVAPKDPLAMEEWKRTGSVSVHFAVSNEAIAFMCDRQGESLATPATTQVPSLGPSPMAGPTAAPVDPATSPSPNLVQRETWPVKEVPEQPHPGLPGTGL